jgi:carbon monoxide dehydrogenase subunit G
MKLVNEFTVAAPIEETWTTLLDVERVASCLPGASIEPVGEDGVYRGRMRIKAGPVSMAYGGTVRLAEVDADAHVALFEARAKETRGTGTAAARIRNSLEPTAEGTHVQVETDLDITGRAAQFGRGMMEDVASKMLGQFSGRLEELVLAGPEAAAAGANGGPSAGPVAVASPEGDKMQPPAPAEGGAEEEPALDLGAAVLGGRAGRLAVGGIGAALLVGLLGILLRRRSRGLSVTVRYRI